METKIESTAAISATLPIGTGHKVFPLSKTQFKDEVSYTISSGIFRSMLENGLISKEEYEEMDTIIANKTASILADLYR